MICLKTNQKKKIGVKKIETTNKTSNAKSEIKPNSEKKIKTSLQEIQDKWSIVLKETQNVNHSLPLILESAFPMAIKDNLLILGFTFDLHISKLKDVKCVDLIEEILQKVFNENILIKAQPIPDNQKENYKIFQENKKSGEQVGEKNSENTINSILDSFGGKIVE